MADHQVREDFGKLLFAQELLDIREGEDLRGRPGVFPLRLHAGSHGLIVRELPPGTALYDLKARILVTLQGLGQGVFLHGVRPGYQFVHPSQHIRDFFVCEQLGRLLSVLRDLQLVRRQRPAVAAHFAEVAPVAGNEFPCAVKGQPGPGREFLLRPAEEFGHFHLRLVHGGEPGLEDHHADLFGRVDHIEHPAGAQRVKPQLQRGGGDPHHAVLEIDDRDFAVGNDEAVRRAHGLGHIGPEIHPLFDVHRRPPPLRADFCNLLQDVLDVLFAVLMHLRGVILHPRPRIFIRAAEGNIQQELAKPVRFRPFRGVYTAFIRDLVTLSSTGRAVEPAIRGGRREDRMLSHPHHRS